MSRIASRPAAAPGAAARRALAILSLSFAAALPSGARAQSAAAPGFSSVDQAQAVVDGAKAARTQAGTDYQAETAACMKTFFATRCADKAREKRDKTMADADARRLPAERYIREVRAREHRERLAQDNAKRDARNAERAASRASAAASGDGAAASRTGPAASGTGSAASGTGSAASGTGSAAPGAGSPAAGRGAPQAGNDGARSTESKPARPRAPRQPEGPRALDDPAVRERNRETFQRKQEQARQEAQDQARKRADAEQRRAQRRAQREAEAARLKGAAQPAPANPDTAK